MAPSNLALNDIAPRINLDGAWDFTLSDTTEWNEIQVPGTWEAQGYDRRYEGPVHYRRQVSLPEDWTGSRILLEFGAVSYACRVMVNDTWVGEHQGMWTPFAVDVTSEMRPGQSNLIEVEVFKPSHLPGARFPFRTCLAGFIPDLGTTFGGLWQDVSMRAFQVWFEDLCLTADLETGELVCTFHTCACPAENIEAAKIDVSVTLAGRKVASCLVESSLNKNNEVHCLVPQPIPWSPENPVLYDFELALRFGDKVLARIHRRTGFRKLSTNGETLLFNGHPVMLRGILHWGWNPDQIAPFFQAAAVREEIRKVKSLGFNLIKLCLFVPNPIFYEIADEEGIFLWQEWPMWLPQVDNTFVERVPSEYLEYMSLARDHPSIVLYSVGCELDKTVEAKLLGQLSDIMRAGTPGALFCDNSGMGEAYGGLQVDFSDFSDYHTYSDLNFLEETLDHWRRDWKSPRPLIFGEFCDSDTYRDPDEFQTHFNGQKPWWMTIDNPLLDWRPEAQPLLDQTKRIEAADLNYTPEQLKKISYNGSLAIRKYVLESIRRRSGIGGYVITGIRDTPISTSGIFDDFGQSKWAPEEFLQLNGECVLCLDGNRQRRWQNGGDRLDRSDLQNEWAGEQVRRQLILSSPGIAFRGTANVAWQLKDPAGKVFANNQEQVLVDLDGVRPREITTISFQLPPAANPHELYLEAEFSIPTAHARNNWSIWSYPKRSAPQKKPFASPALHDPGFLLTELEEMIPLSRLRDQRPPPVSSLVIASSLPDWWADFLKTGGGLLLLQWGDGPLPAVRRPFWREAIRIFAPHPVWSSFGIGGDLRFLGISNDVSLDLIDLNRVLPGLSEVNPILRRLDARDFSVSEFILEARLNKGVLLACTLRITGGLGRQPSGLHRNIAGQWLLWAMLDYIEEKLK